MAWRLPGPGHILAGRARGRDLGRPARPGNYFGIARRFTRRGRDVVDLVEGG